MNKDELEDKVEEVGKKPVTLKLWVVVAIALVSFVAGAVLF